METESQISGDNNRGMVVERLRGLIEEYSQNDQELEDLFIDQKILVKTANILDKSAYDPFQLFPNDNWFVEDASLAQTIAIGIYNFLFDDDLSLDQFLENLDEILEKIKTAEAVNN